MRAGALRPGSAIQLAPRGSSGKTRLGAHAMENGAIRERLLLAFAPKLQKSKNAQDQRKILDEEAPPERRSRAGDRPLGQSIGVFAVIAYGLLAVAALLLPETKGRMLTAEAA